MPDAPYIFDGSPDNFASLVLENSIKGPVLVNYWAPWAGPCLKLWPTLEKLAVEYAGKFLLVNINTDKHKPLAERYGVNSLPTLKVFRHGKIVDEVHGAESETSLRRMIENHIARESDRVLREAVTMYQNGDIDAAMSLLQRAAEEDPYNLRIPVTLAKLLVRHEHFEHASELLTALPEAAHTHPEVATLQAHIDFIRTAHAAPPAAELKARLHDHPGDAETHYRLAALSLVDDEMEAALEHLLMIVHHGDAGYYDRALRGMKAVFSMLGTSHPVARRYRTKLSNIVHSG